MDQGSLNFHWAAALLNGLAQAGVRHLVASPGSRNTPLLLAAKRHLNFSLKMMVDERSAAFYALGMAKALGEPVGLIATSGSAPGNWMPAVMEASESGIPLLLLSADRPWTLRQCAANQTTDQTRLFGSFSRAFFEVPEPASNQLSRIEHLGRQLVQASLGVDPGPVQANLAFPEPLVPQETLAKLPVQFVSIVTGHRLQPSTADLDFVRESVQDKPGLLVVGYGCGDAQAILELARAWQTPVLADPLSDLRFRPGASDWVQPGYDLALRQPPNYKPAWTLRFGQLPVSKSLAQWLVSLDGTLHIAVEPRGRWSDPNAQVQRMIGADTSSFCEQLATTVRPAPSKWPVQPPNSSADLPPPFAQILRHIITQLPSDSLLFCGNSLAIRYLDAWSGTVEKRIRVAGNRGLSGIDGNLSTALGMTAALELAGRSVAVLGDLTSFHDLNALSELLASGLILVVMNNGGGGIFQHLSQHQLPEFAELWQTPVALDFVKAADAFGVSACRVASEQQFVHQFERALSTQEGALIEVIL